MVKKNGYFWLLENYLKHFIQSNRIYVFVDVSDIDKHFPGLLKATIEWFKIYKIPDGKPENQFAFNGEAKSRDFALHVIEEVHKHWENLVKKEANAGSISWLVIFCCEVKFQRFSEWKEENSAFHLLKRFIHHTKWFQSLKDP